MVEEKRSLPVAAVTLSRHRLVDLMVMAAEEEKEVGMKGTIVLKTRMMNRILIRNLTKEAMEEVTTLAITKRVDCRKMLQKTR